MKVDVRPHEDGPHVETRIYVFGVEGISSERKLSQFVPEILRQAGLPENTMWAFSQRAGCKCGCSPGFILSTRGQEIFVDIE